MEKVIKEFETVLLIAKVIGYKPTIKILHQIVNNKNNPLNSEDVKDIYDEEYFKSISEQKKKRIINGIPVNSYIDLSIRYFEKLENKNIRILDFGCGTGNFVLALASLGFNIDGFDYFEPTIKAANKKARELNIKKRCGFYSELSSLKMNQYDYIVFSDVVEHISKKELRKVISTLSKYITKNGKMIFHTPNGLFHESCPRRIRLFDIYYFLKDFLLFQNGQEKDKIAKLKAAYYDQVHINIMTPQELKNILSEKRYSNFKIKLFDEGEDNLLKRIKSVGSFWLICEKSN